MTNTTQNIWIQLSKTIGCGGCKKNTTVESAHSCGICGRMLCGDCGKYCTYHSDVQISNTMAYYDEHGKLKSNPEG